MVQTSGIIKNEGRKKLIKHKIDKSTITFEDVNTCLNN